MYSSHYDVIIIGAGPAGCGCALALRKSGLNVAIVDRSVFPRQKICGDAIPGPSLKHLKQILPEFQTEFSTLLNKHRVLQSVVHLSNGKSIQINWKTDAYNCVRASFDDFLLNLVKRYSNTKVYEGSAVCDLFYQDETVAVKIQKEDTVLYGKMVIGSDGANSIVSKTFNIASDSKLKTGIALSAYFSDVETPKNTNSFFPINKANGYFWIFPVGENLYNIGCGLKANNRPQKLNLKKVFDETISKHPLVSHKLRNAKALSKIKAFKLPTDGQKTAISGKRFLLVGDAAHLVDPLGGHGIDKAIYSGILAAKHTLHCFEKNDFTSSFNRAFDQSIYNNIGKKLGINHILMKLFSGYPWMINCLYHLIKLRNNIALRMQPANEKQSGFKYQTSQSIIPEPHHQ